MAYLFFYHVGYDVLDGLSKLRAKGQKSQNLEAKYHDDALACQHGSAVQGTGMVEVVLRVGWLWHALSESELWAAFPSWEFILPVWSLTK